MRDILFRGKRVDNGEWVEGQYYKQSEYYGYPQTKHYIIASTETLDYDQALEYHEVVAETVGQYIGCKDIDNTMVFEGDILERETIFLIPSGRICVGYECSSFVYAKLSSNNRNYTDPIDDNEYGVEIFTYKIIGNIHDNPELLEVE